MILPSLRWHAGRKASAVRTAAASCLRSFFENKSTDSLDYEALLNSDTYPQLLTSMNGLVEEEAVQTRIFVCKTYTRLFKVLGPKIGPQILLKIASGNCLQQWRGVKLTTSVYFQFWSKDWTTQATRSGSAVSRQLQPRPTV